MPQARARINCRSRTRCRATASAGRSRGRIISEFGSKADGGHNDGIDLAVPQGTSVKAAENGVVAYAGNELKGYGNLVLIRHSNNWVSAYAHNEELLVKRGDKVRRGQVIAKAGATGAVSQPQVHFELRKGSRPVDPTKYHGERSAADSCVESGRDPPTAVADH